MSVSGPASRLEEVRKAFGLTKAALAAQLAVNASFLSNIHAGRRPLSPNLAERIEHEFGVRRDWLLDGRAPALVPHRRHRDAVVEALAPHEFPSRPGLPGRQPGPGGYASLPVFSQPLEGHPLDHLHMGKGLRRSVARDLWRTSRYYLRILPSLPKPEDLHVDDHLLIETRPEPWRGTIRCLCLLQVRKKCVLAWAHARGLDDGNVLLDPPFDIPSVKVSPRSKKPRRFGFLGLVVQLEREMPVPDASTGEDGQDDQRDE